MDYREQLELEVKKINEDNPEIKLIIEAVKSGLIISNMDIDYAIERDWRIYSDVQKILNGKSVKRSELIDFNNWRDTQLILPDSSEDIVDEYLKSINVAKRN